MKSIIFLFCLMVAGIFEANAQQKITKMMQVTTIESVVGGGVGRSRVVITKEDGTQDEKDMENLFSVMGINFKNIKSNELLILQLIKSYTDTGWKIQSVTPLTLSPGSGGAGIFMTRYLLVKEDDKK
jgi:hypothetical protein